MPTVTTEFSFTVVGNGVVDKANVPAPVASVASWPTTTPSIATSNVVLAVVPLTLTLKFVTAVPLEEVALVTEYVTVPVAPLFAGSDNVPDSEV